MPGLAQLNPSITAVTIGVMMGTFNTKKTTQLNLILFEISHVPKKERKLSDGGDFLYFQGVGALERNGFGLFFIPIFLNIQTRYIGLDFKLRRLLHCKLIFLLQNHFFLLSFFFYILKTRIIL